MLTVESRQIRPLGVLAALLLVIALVPLAAEQRPAGADPVLVPLTCGAVDTMTATGEVSLYGALALPVGSIIQPVVDQIAGTELPIPVPADVSATDEIEPGGTIALGGSVELDLGDAVGSMVDLIRVGVEQAGYPGIAESFSFSVSLQDLELPFPHPAGTTASGAPVAVGDGVSARTEGGATVVSVESFEIASEGETSVDAAASWSLVDGGDPAPRSLDHTMGTVTFDLEVEFGATIPKDLIAPIVEATFPDLYGLFQLLAPPQLPLTGGAIGPWECTQGETPTTLATTLVVDPVPNPVDCTTPFIDVDSDHTFCEEIAWGVGTGMIHGWPDGTFRPSLTVSRQGFAAFLHRSQGSPEAGPGAPTFTDVGPTHDFRAAISWLADEEITSGYADGTFRPTNFLSRQAIAVMLHRHAGSPVPSVEALTFPDLPDDPTFRTAVIWLAETGVTTGYDDGTFRPTAPITRQSLIAMLQRYLTQQGD